jgi:group I intron endonuclease
VLFENLTQDQAEQKEIELIAEHKSNQREHGYNIANGGRTNSGFQISEERKKRISETLKKRYATQKNAKYGKPLSEETKRKLSVANLGKTPSEETRHKISIGNKGKRRTEETKQQTRAREQSKVSNILQVDFNGNIINTFNSIQEASRVTTVPANKICAVCKGKRHYAKGYIWLYEQDKNLISEKLKYFNKVVR